MNIDMRSKKPLHPKYEPTEPQPLRVPTKKDIAEMAAKELNVYITEYKLNYIIALSLMELKFLFGGENPVKKTRLDYQKQAVMNHIKNHADLDWASCRKAGVDDARELYKTLIRKREDPEPEAPEPKAEPDAGRAAEAPKQRKKIVKTRA